MSQYIGRMLKIMYILDTNIPMIPSDEYGKNVQTKQKILLPSLSLGFGKVCGLFVCEERG
jgi:hypothetical protein